MKNVIIIMAKVPGDGNVKTRLQSVLSAVERAELAACLMADTIAKASMLDKKLLIAYTPEDRSDFFDQYAEHEFELVSQHGTDLGEKMFNAFRYAFERFPGSSVVMLGTDSPTVPARIIEGAFSLLENDTDAVLGETEDGGFYLIGLRVLKNEVFENVIWSSPATFEQTGRNFEGLGFKLLYVPKLFDVDCPPDLERLKNELAEQSELSPKTARWIAKVFG